MICQRRGPYSPQSRMISANELLHPAWDHPKSVKAFTTTRLGGVSQPPFNHLNLGMNAGDKPEHVLQNRLIVRQSLPNEPLWLKQVHGTLVSTPASRLLSSGGAFEADAAVTQTPNEVLAILTADCIPVLFANKKGDVVGAAHAGWRGLSGGVLENTVREMCALSVGLRSQDITAWMGPAIGPDAFEVSEDVLKAFESQGNAIIKRAFIPSKVFPGKYLANLYCLAEDRLRSIGISNIQGGRFCTFSDSAQYFSYRRDGVTGRFASFIWISSAT